MIIGIVPSAVAFVVTPTMWNESRYLSSNIIFGSIWLILFIIPAYLVRANPQAWIGLIGFGTFLSLVLVLVLEFGFKLYYLIALRTLAKTSGPAVSDIYDDVLQPKDSFIMESPKGGGHDVKKDVDGGIKGQDMRKKPDENDGLDDI